MISSVKLGVVLSLVTSVGFNVANFPSWFSKRLMTSSIMTHRKLLKNFKNSKKADVNQIVIKQHLSMIEAVTDFDRINRYYIWNGKTGEQLFSASEGDIGCCARTGLKITLKWQKKSRKFLKNFSKKVSGLHFKYFTEYFFKNFLNLFLKFFSTLWKKLFSRKSRVQHAILDKRRRSSISAWQEAIYGRYVMVLNFSRRLRFWPNSKSWNRILSELWFESEFDFGCNRNDSRVRIEVNSFFFRSRLLLNSFVFSNSICSRFEFMLKNVSVFLFRCRSHF